MWLKVSNKLKLIFLICMIVLISNAITYKLIHKNFENVIESIERDNELNYSVSFVGNEGNKTGKTMLKPSVRNIRETDELEKKINMSLSEVFVKWMPEKFKYPYLSAIKINLSTNEYLSINMCYTFSGRIKEHMNICNTIDMKTGDALYLDDLFEVDEEFNELILTEGIPMLAYNWMTDEYNAPYPIDRLNDNEIEYIHSKLQLCCEPFNEENWVFKPTFFLEENRLYLVNVFNQGSEAYIELEKIEHKLKVDKW